jgi:hypothetical protein
LRVGQSEILSEERMAKIQDEAVEAEAPAMLRETIQRSNWYPTCPRKSGIAASSRTWKRIGS